MVEDDADTAESPRILSNLFAHDVRIARDGPRTMAAALRWSPEIILVEIGLPRLDGYWVDIAHKTATRGYRWGEWDDHSTPASRPLDIDDQLTLDMVERIVIRTDIT